MIAEECILDPSNEIEHIFLWSYIPINISNIPLVIVWVL